MSLATRIALISGDLPDMTPQGKNDFHKYKFFTNTQILGMLRPRLAHQRIMIVPETVEEAPIIELTTAKGGTSRMTRLLVTFRVRDGITGESFTGQAMGYGDDGGDKGANKAYTAAQKNFLLRLFEIGGESDTEDDPTTDRRAEERERGTASRAVNVESASGEGVGRGGRSAGATDIQITSVSRYTRDLELDPATFSALSLRTIKEGPAEPTWESIKEFVAKLDSDTIGTLLRTMQLLAEETDDARNEEARDAANS
jgi:hypothetical protein